jgi:hypothetical protein
LRFAIQHDAVIDHHLGRIAAWEVELARDIAAAPIPQGYAEYLREWEIRNGFHRWGLELDDRERLRESIERAETDRRRALLRASRLTVHALASVLALIAMPADILSSKVGLWTNTGSPWSAVQTIGPVWTLTFSLLAGVSVATVVALLARAGRAWGTWYSMRREIQGLHRQLTDSVLEREADAFVDNVIRRIEELVAGMRWDRRALRWTAANPRRPGPLAAVRSRPATAARAVWRWLRRHLLTLLLVAALAILPARPGLTATAAGGHDYRFPWAGYQMAPGKDAGASVSADWVVPSVTPNLLEDNATVTWVGLNGAPGDNTVQQTGTGAYQWGGVVVYFAWYEFVTGPTSGMNFYFVPVAPGDHMSGMARYDGHGRYTLTLADHTRHWTRTTVGSGPDQRPYSAEVIQEAPLSLPGGAQSPLANFGHTTFSDARVNGTPMWRFPPDPYNIVDDGVTETDTSQFDRHHDFTVTWRATAPAGWDRWYLFLPYDLVRLAIAAGIAQRLWRRTRGPRPLRSAVLTGVLIGLFATVNGLPLAVAAVVSLATTAITGWLWTRGRSR